MKTLRLSTLALLAAMLATAPAAAASLSLGGNNSLLELDGSGSGATSTVSVDAGNLLGGSSGGSSTVIDASVDSGSGDGALLGDTTATGTVDLGGTGDSSTLLDLFGDGSDSITASANVGNSGGTTADVLLDLFGDGGTSGGTAGDGTSNGGGSSGTGSVNHSGDSGGMRGAGNTGLRVASIDASTGACFTPNAAQVAKLVSRHQYGPKTFSAWTGLSSLKIVDIGLCTSAAASITGAPNIGRLQAFISSNAAIRAGLNKQGHSPGDVIAVDKSGSTLVLYVI